MSRTTISNISSVEQRPRSQDYCITKIQPAPEKVKTALVR